MIYMLHNASLLLQNLDPLIVSLISLSIYFVIILIAFRIFGKIGIYVFIAVAIIGANLQVLKLSEFGIFKEPVALGTALFATIFFSSDLLSEHYGKKAAQKGVFIGFFAFFLWSIITQITIGYPPLDPKSTDISYSWALNTQPALENLFTLIPGFFVASIIAYFISQLLDIYIYMYVKKVTKNKLLFLRNNLSTMISSLIDNIIFSTLAFIVFNPEPINMSSLIFTYILGTYVLRILYSLFDTPFIYLSYYFLPKEVTQNK